MKKIMFVCHGNICRSPMAEFMFKDMIKGKYDFYIQSAATSREEIIGDIGNPVYPPAERELLKHNIKCDGKRATQLKYEDYNNYDLFICMDDNNIRNTLRIFKEDKDDKVKKLMGFTGSDKDVSDPWYTGDFKTTYDDIYKGLTGLLKYLTNDC